jgi:zona occludens toxin (predicted ATPase)
MLKVSFLYHDDAKKLHHHEDSVHTIDVKKVNKDDIAYFKNLNHGKDQQTSTENRDKELEFTEENVL